MLFQESIKLKKELVLNSESCPQKLQTKAKMIQQRNNSYISKAHVEK